MKESYSDWVSELETILQALNFEFKSQAKFNSTDKLYYRSVLVRETLAKVGLVDAVCFLLNSSIPNFQACPSI